MEFSPLLLPLMLYLCLQAPLSFALGVIVAAGYLAVGRQRAVAAGLLLSCLVPLAMQFMVETYFFTVTEEANWIYAGISVQIWSLGAYYPFHVARQNASRRVAALLCLNAVWAGVIWFALLRHGISVH